MTTGLSLGNVVDVMVDYGTALDEKFYIELVKCSLVSSSQSFPLISDGLVNQENGVPNLLNQLINRSEYHHLTDFGRQSLYEELTSE